MRFETLTSLLTSKNKKASYEIANKIERMVSKLAGVNTQEETKSKDLNRILEMSYELLKGLDKKLEEGSKKFNEFGKNSGYAIARINFSTDNNSAGMKNTGKNIAEFSTRLSETVMPKLYSTLIELRDKVLTMKEEQKGLKTDNIQTLYEEIGKLLENEGLKTVENTGKFDPENQRIVGTISTDNIELDNYVFCTVRPGYTFRGGLSRPQEVLIYVYENNEKNKN